MKKEMRSAFDWKARNLALLEGVWEDRDLGKLNPRVFEAMLKTPRHMFVSPFDVEKAYDDKPMSLGYEGSTISQPRVVARMTSLLNPQPEESVIEIGTGLGYQATVLSHLCKQVRTFEVNYKLIPQAEAIRNRLGIENLEICQGIYGKKDYADLVTPEYDGVIVTASMPPNPDHPLFGFLKEGGRLIAPVGGVYGDSERCEVIEFVKIDDSIEIRTILPGFQFVRMEGAYGWTEFYKTVTGPARQDFMERLRVKK